MKLKLLFFLICGLFVIKGIAQPVNDDCSGAINLGTLPTPGACAGGIENGAATTVNGNLAGATPANPYLYSTGCAGAVTSTSSPANDVWYFFTASGHVGHFNITGTIVNPNIAVYAGTNCANVGNVGGVGGCTVGNAGGTASLTVNQMTIGQTYYIQISSNNDASFGTYTLSVDNDNDCNNCLTSSTLSVNPPPVNGTYQPGQVVNFCYTVNGWSQQNTNWLHGVQVTFGAGWSGISGQAPPAAICNAGTWAWYNSVTSSGGSGLTFGQGFYFDTPDGGTNPGNNFGDAAVDAFGNPTCDPSPATPLTFCFNMTVAAACNPGASLNVTINTTGDGESGGWQDAGCSGDPAYIFNAQVSCCPPTMSSTPSTCTNNDGTATATPVGAAGPYDYSWSGPGGYSSSSTGVAGASTINGLAAGTYTVTITDATFCAVSNTVTVGGNPAVPAAPTTAPVSYCLNATAVPLTATPSAGGTLNWYGTNAVGGVASGTAPTPVTTPVSTTTYYVSQTVGGCEGPRAPLVVTVNPLPTPVANNNSPVCQGSAINLTSGGGTGYAWTGPNAFASATQNPTIASATPAMAGTYSVTVTDANGCQAQATTSVTVNPAPVPVVGSNSPVCVGATINLTASGGTGYAWTGPNAFASATQNPSIPSATAAMSGTYSVTVTDANGCTAQGTTPVTVNPSAPPVVGSNSPVCAGATINLTCSVAGGTYAWTGPNGFADVNQNPSIPSATTVMSGTYSVTVTFGGGCSSSGSTSVTVNPLPVPVVNSNSPVCVGATINLTASGGTSYAWTGPNAFASATQNPSIPSATAAMSGTYSVTVTDANSCQAQGTTPVTVNPLPTPVVNSNSPVCVGTTINLTASGGTGYAWTGPNAFASATQNPSIPSATAAMAGTYSVTVTDANGCQAQGTTPVVVNPLPIPVVGSNSPVCAGATINLTASGGTGYSWTGPNAFASATQNPSIPSATVAMAGTYSVMVIDGNGCQAQGTTPVVVNPLPVPVVGSNSPVCVGATINLTSTGGTGYSWTGPNAFASATQNPSIPSATAVMTGTYSVTVTDANGCQAQGTTPVVVNPLPVPFVGSNSPVCAGATINLTANGGTGYIWTGPNAFASAVQNPSIASATVAMAGTYSVTVTDGNGCQAQGTTSVTVNPLPAPVANNIGGPYCVNGTINLTSSPAGMSSYNWTGPLGFTSTAMDTTIVLVTVPMGGTYTVSVTDANGCSSSATTNLVVNPLPTVTANNNGPVCAGTTLSLSATGGVSYSWSGPNSFSSPSATPNIPGVTLAAAGTYTVVATDANGCTNANLTAVTINPTPTPVANTNGPVCVNAALNLSTTQVFAAYSWTGPNGFASPAANPVISPVTTAAAGTYSVTVTDVNGCTGSATVSTTIHPLPTATLGAITPGCAPSCRDFHLSSSSTLVAWGWNLGNGVFNGNDTVLQHCYDDPGVYNVAVYITDNNNCSDSVRFNNWVTVYAIPDAEFTYGPSDLSVLEPEVHFSDLSVGSNITGYTWNFGDPLNSSSILENPNFTYPDVGYYNVMLTIINDVGCIDSVIHTVYIPEDWAIYVPTAFSPNEDGVNDYFFAKGVGIDEKNYKMWIFDRWGNQIYYTEDWNGAGWDGTVQGHPTMVQEDVYIWKIQARSFRGDKYSEVGHVTVVR
jgi:gliding motility-associated-like protein